MPADGPSVTLPTRRAGASTVELDDNVTVYDDVGQLLVPLNTSAAAVYGTTTVDDMARALAAHPDDAADIGEDVRQKVRKLVELGLVVDGGPA